MVIVRRVRRNLCLGLLFILSFAVGCGNAPSSPTPTAPTPTPVPTITVSFTTSLMDFEYGASGDNVESVYLFSYFTTCLCMPSTMVAPVTFGLNGYIGGYSPTNFPMPVSLVHIGTGVGTALMSMPATLGQALTWITNLAVPTADQTQATSNSLPSNLYTDTATWPVSMFWRLDASADYGFAGTGTTTSFAWGRTTSAPVSNLTDLQIPQTVILSIPVTIP